MDRKQPEILREKDILGLDKPASGSKPVNKPKDGWMLKVALILLVLIAAVLFYFNM